MYLEDKSRPESPNDEVCVDLVLPAYNEEKHIYESLKSIYNLEYSKEKLGVILVDDGSKDNTLIEAKRFAKDHKDLKITLIKHKKNRGKAAALNTALKLTKAPFIVTMDADSFAEPDALSQLLKFSNENDIVTPAVVAKNTKGILERLQAIEYVYGNYLSNILSGFDAQLVAPGPFSLFKTESLRAVGGFDETSVTEDLEIVYRMRKKGYKIIMSPRAIVKTDIPRDLKTLIAQRKRWHLGFFDVVGKYPKSMNVSHEFGRQTILKSLYFLVSIAFLIIFVWGFFKWMEPVYYFFRAVGFDWMPYLLNLEFNPDLLILDPQTIFYFAVTLLITSTFLYFAFRFSEEKGGNLFDAIIFLITYGFALSMATILATVSWIKRENKW